LVFVLLAGFILSSTLNRALAEPPPASQPASLPAEGPERIGNRLKSTPNDVHGLILDETPSVFKEGTSERLQSTRLNSDGLVAQRAIVHTSRIINTEFPFNDLVPSWNIDVPAGGGFAVQIRMARQQDDFWTPFYYLGSWGRAPQVDKKVTADDNGLINIDYFQSNNRFDRIQYRVLLSGSDLGHPPIIRRVGLAYSNTLNDVNLFVTHRRKIDPGPKEKWARRLPVPWRSQKAEDKKISGSICSPTSVSMVMHYRGIDEPTAKVCATIWDEEYELYGNWWRAVQGAYTYGLPGYIERFGDWNAVKQHIARDEPVIASIKVKKGQLRNSPYRETNGHLLVIVGFDEAGNVHINDPAAATADQGTTTYAREDMEQVWLANGGVGYIILPRP